MPPTEPRLLCVSIHDVAPATWPACVRLAQAMRALGPLPLTWLVVPRYHGQPWQPGPWDAGLAEALARGDELALHGDLHLDTAPLPWPGLGARLLRRGYTRGEGEFAALTVAEAARRLARGRAWFAARGWPLHGFVAPAWLLGAQAWTALQAEAFAYTTTFTRLHLLPAGGAVASPALVYAARNRAGRLASRWLVTAGAARLAAAPLVRLALHPADASHPALLAHAQRTAARLLASHQPVTKHTATQLFSGRRPTCHPANAPGPRPDRRAGRC